MINRVQFLFLILGLELIRFILRWVGTVYIFVPSESFITSFVYIIAIGLLYYYSFYHLIRLRLNSIGKPLLKKHIWIGIAVLFGSPLLSMLINLAPKDSFGIVEMSIEFFHNLFGLLMIALTIALCIIPPKKIEVAKND